MIESMIEAFNKGGIWMWAILMFQLFSLAIMIERCLFLFGRRRVGQQEYALKFEENIRKGDLDSVISQSKSEIEAQPLAQAIYSGTQVALDCGGKEEIQGRMDESLLKEVADLDKNTNFLVMLGNVGTLTGLLGTIVGMIKSFSAVTYANPADKATLLSSGISEAMNTTAYGLIVAIPALIMYAVLQNRSNTLQDDLSQGALKIFNLLSYSYQTVWDKKQAKA